MEYFVILLGIGLSCLFLLSAYLLKKVFPQMQDGPISPMCVQKPPVILTNQFWPVRQEVLKHLGLDDLKNLGSAFPSLRIEEDQCYNKRQLERDLLLNEKVFWDGCLCHPIYKAIRDAKDGVGSVAHAARSKVNTLIEKIGSDVDRIPRYDLGTVPYTPLMFCAIYDDAATARRLVSKGADLYQRGVLRENCLHVAALLGSVRMVRFLVQEARMDRSRLDCEGRAEEEERKRRGRTALQIAQAWHPHNHELIQLLTNKASKLRRSRTRLDLFSEY